MSQILPFVPSVTPQLFTTQLGDTQYGFDVRWNDRDSAWYINVLTENGELIRASLKIVLGGALGHREVDPRWPPGVLVPLDTTNSGVDAGFEDLGTRVLVYFFPFEEWLS